MEPNSCAVAYATGSGREHSQPIDGKIYSLCNENPKEAEILNLAKQGITQVWLPPPHKAMAPRGQGYEPGTCCMYSIINAI